MNRTNLLDTSATGIIAYDMIPKTTTIMQHGYAVLLSVVRRTEKEILRPHIITVTAAAAVCSRTTAVCIIIYTGWYSVFIYMYTAVYS